MTMQKPLFGDVPERPATVTEGIILVLREVPAARNSYKRLMLEFWRRFCGLEEALGDRMEDFEQWWLSKRAVAPKTLQNRAMEVQRDHPSLEADEEVEAWRQRQARAGKVE